MKPANSLRMILAVASIAAAASSAAQVVIVEPSAPPPPPRAEVVPAPRAGYVWDGGHWRWNARRIPNLEISP